jgi:hypothetical protein
MVLTKAGQKEETKFDALGFKQLYCGPDPVVELVYSFKYQKSVLRMIHSL